MKQAQSCILHQQPGVGTRMDGDLGQLRFLLLSEMYFHAFEVREKRS